MSKFWIPVLLILTVLVIDQSVKFHVKTNYSLETGSKILGSDKFRIHFTENKGMAFGIEWGGDLGKLLLTIFRIVAVVFIGMYLRSLIKNKAPAGLRFSIALIMAGALGNIIDSVFYGVLFSESLRHTPPAVFLSADGGYAPLFYGKVVDMFYFPIWQGYYPDWFPMVGGNRFSFFQPVFNVADAAITIGVLCVLIFFRGYFSVMEETPEEEVADTELPLQSQPDSPPDSQQGSEEDPLRLSPEA